MMTVVVENNSSIAQTGSFTVGAFFNFPPASLSGQPVAETTVPSLGAFSKATLTFAFPSGLPLSAEVWRAYAMVDPQNVIGQQHTGSGTHVVKEINVLQPQRVLIALNGSSTFQATLGPVGASLTLAPDTLTLSASSVALGTFGTVNSNAMGQSSFTFFSNGNATGVLSGSLTAGKDFERVFIEVSKPGIVGPSVVPGLTKYQYRLLAPLGGTPTNVIWSLSGLVGSGSLAEAFIESGTNQQTAVVYFRNIAGLPTLSVNYSVGTIAAQNFTTISIIQIDLINHFLANTGRPATISTPAHVGITDVLDKPRKSFVTENFPGSDWTKFTYKGEYQAVEPFVFVDSATLNAPTITPAYSVATELKLTAPAQNPSAINSIEIGYIQHVYLNSATATYGGTRKRTGFKPHAETGGLDWLENPLENPGATVRWPWYADDGKSTRNPVVPQGTFIWTGTISMGDSPQATFPKFFNGFTEDHLWEQAGQFSFHVLRVAARTKDSRNGADTNYFQLAVCTIHLRYKIPLAEGNPSFVLLPSTLAAQPQPLNLPNLNKAPAAIICGFDAHKGLFALDKLGTIGGENESMVRCIFNLFSG